MYKVLRVVKIHKDRNCDGDCQGLGKEESAKFCLISIKFQFHKMKSVMGIGDDCTTK